MIDPEHKAKTPAMPLPHLSTYIMKTIVLIPLAIVTTVTALGGLGGCATRTSYVDLYGFPAQPTEYQRTISITPTTRYVHVEGGETIRFLVDGKAFAWSFNVAKTVNHFDLNDVAPPGMLQQKVTAIVAPDPRYIGPV